MGCAVDPIDMVQRMWVHVQDVVKALDSRDLHWRELSAQDLTDLLVYLQNIPATKPPRLDFVLPAGDVGAELIREKGCTECHSGPTALERTLWRKTLTEAAVEMWNHAQKMPTRTPDISVDEMREIISYAWSQEFFTPRGNPVQGRRVFDGKCNGACHGLPALAPAIRTRVSDYTAMSIVAAVWAHDSKQLMEKAERDRAWPTLSPSEMANVIAYLNSLRKQD